MGFRHVFRLVRYESVEVGARLSDGEWDRVTIDAADLLVMSFRRERESSSERVEVLQGEREGALEMWEIRVEKLGGVGEIRVIVEEETLDRWYEYPEDIEEGEWERGVGN
eukprot:TRINITY_DN64016_c0_g1_i1.p3 TRINITY_DN64016_c0_g1~~TRINITY_DN64016_c0_g1_i1.p3  ORF type:complete len:110 (-),score=16.98 TRINITY_DN64016_c0_g1_i1:125-454(-)